MAPALHRIPVMTSNDRSLIFFSLVLLGGLATGCAGQDASPDGDLPTGGEPSPAADAGADAGDDGGAGAEGGDAGTGDEPTSDGGDMPPGDPPGDGGDLPPADEETPYTIEAFAYEDPREPEFQPLGRVTKELVRSDELAVLVPSLAGAGTIDDDRVDAAPSTIVPTASVGPGTVRDAVGGDVDGDGRDELLVLTLDASGCRVRVLDADDGANASQGEILDPRSTLKAEVATGDIDADGRDEVVIASVLGSGGIATASSLRVLDDADAGFAPLFAFDMVGARDMSAVTAEIDDGEGAEIVVMAILADGTAIGEVLHPDLGFAADILGAQLLGAEPGFTPLSVAATAGDLDDDGRDEPVFVTLRRNDGGGTGQIVATALDDGEAGFAPLETHTLTIQSSTWSYASQDAWSVETGDLDGDRRDEVLVSLRDYSTDSAGDYVCRLGHIAFDNDPNAGGFLLAAEWDDAVGFPLDYEARCGFTVLDDDRDGRDEVVTAVVAPNGTPSWPVHLSRFEAAFSGETWAVTKESAWQTAVMPATSSPVLPVLTGGDFHGDALRVRHTGAKWLVLPDPMIMVVAAAPPTEASLSSQNFTLSGTNYGLDLASGETHGGGTGVSAGATVSLEAEDPLGIFSASVSSTIEAELTRSQTKTLITTEGSTYGGGSGQDQVIFQGSLYMSYEYEIVAAADPALVGTFMTIDEPVATREYAWSVPFYNETITDPSKKIPTDLLVHTPGDVSSYRRGNDVPTTALGDAVWIGTERQVGQNDGFHETSFSIAQDHTVLEEIDLSMSSTVGGAIGGAGFEATIGISQSSIYEVTVGENVRYEGVVGGIADTSEYTDWHYAFGMFIRTGARPDGARFQVIDYWVDDLGPAHTP